jgi:hypothetical protein
MEKMGKLATVGDLKRGLLFQWIGFRKYIQENHCLCVEK